MKNSLKVVAIKFLEAGAFAVLCCFLFGKACLEFYTIYASSVFHIVDLNNNWLFPYEVSSTQRYATFRACLLGGEGPQVGEVTCLSISSLIFK